MQTSILSLNKQTVYKFQSKSLKNYNAEKYCTFTSITEMSVLKTLF